MGRRTGGRGGEANRSVGQCGGQGGIVVRAWNGVQRTRAGVKVKKGVGIVRDEFELGFSVNVGTVRVEFGQLILTLTLTLTLTLPLTLTLTLTLILTHSLPWLISLPPFPI